LYFDEDASTCMTAEVIHMYWRQKSQENIRHGELMPTQEDVVLQTQHHKEKQPGKRPTKGRMMMG
jgi:hypothetical protein